MSHYDWGTAGFESEGMAIQLPGAAETVPFLLDSLHAGFLAKKQYVDWAEQNAQGEFTNRHKLFENQGVQVHIPGTALKGYASTVTTGVVTGDFSGSKAANLRVHSVQWPTSSGIRQIFGFASFIIKDTSASDPTPIVPATADNVTDNIMAMWLGDVDGTLALFIGTDGTTDDVKYTTDPMADSITWTSAVTYSHANDVVYAGCYLEQFRRHVIWGVINQVAGLYAWKNDDSLPVTSSTMQPVVFTEDKDLEGSIALVTFGPNVAGWGGTDHSTGNSGNTGNLLWKNPGRITASDDSRASFDQANSDQDEHTGTLIGGGFFTVGSEVPLASLIKGIHLGIEKSESSASNGIFDFAVGIMTSGSRRGVPRPDGTEWPTTEAQTEYGDTDDDGDDDFGIGGLTGADVGSIQAYIQADIRDVNDASDSGLVDKMELSLTARFPGTQVPIFEGLHGKGSPLLSFPNIVPIIEPVSDDGTGITVRRRLAYYTFAVDADDRILCDVSRPYTGLPYVGLMTDHLGGLAVFGGADSSTWDQGVLVGPDASNRDVENLELPSTYGDADTVRVYGAFERQASSALFAGIHHGDNADAQTWINSGPGAWNAYGVLQSLSGTAIASAPIPFAMTNPTTHAYRFFPNSTTNLHVTHEKVDNDPYSDSRLTNSTQARHTGALRVQAPHMNLGAGDVQRSLTAIEAESFEIDDGTSYGSIDVEFDAGEDLTMATPDVDVTFDAAGEVFTQRNVASAGQQYDSGIIAIEFNASTGAKTPQALPIVFYLAMAPEDERTFVFYGVKGSDPNKELLHELEANRRTSGSSDVLHGVDYLSVYRLNDELHTNGVPCQWVNAEVGRDGNITLTFREVKGGSAA